MRPTRLAGSRMPTGTRTVSGHRQAQRLRRPPATGTGSLALVVVLVVVPPPVGRRLGIAGRRVLPLLLASQRGDVEVAPGAAHVLIAAGVDEVGPEDAIALADE